MISKQISPHLNRQSPLKTTQKHQQIIQEPIQEPKVIQNKTLSSFRSQLKSIEQKIKNLKTKRYCSKQTQWRDLDFEINQIKVSLELRELRKIFVRKFEQQIRLLNDFQTSKYQKSMLLFCFLCCPTCITKKLKHYKFIDQVFEKTISEVQKTQRNIYFYMNLLYIKLFTMMVAVDKRMKEQFNKKMIEAMDVQSKQHKIIQQRIQQVGQLQQINDVFVMEQDNFKDLNNSNRIVASYIIQSDNPNQIMGKTQQREPLDTSLMRQNCYDEFKTLSKQIQIIISNDWQEIINCEEWTSLSYYGFIQINSEHPIYTPLEFKDCKLKTNHLFKQISSSSFDLRTYLIKNYKKSLSKRQYILNSLNQDAPDFQLTFWLQESNNTQKNHQNIQKFLLLAMRIGIKQKIYRNCSLSYKEDLNKWMIDNYVHMSYNEKNVSEENLQKKENVKSETSYRSVSENPETTTPEMFWWVNLGEALVQSIFEVANKRRALQKNQLTGLKRAAFSRKSRISHEWQNNPQSIDRLMKPPTLNMNKKQYHSANQI